MKLSKPEADIITYLEKDRGRKLTREEINLSLDQARAIGHLESEPESVGMNLCGVTATWRRTAALKAEGK